MSVFRKYISRQFQWRNCLLQCEDAEDFYLSCWQKNHSVIPLLLWRTLLFLSCLAILIASLVLTIQDDYGGYWIAYLTHWGLLTNTVASGLGVVVSAYCYFCRHFDSIFGLPWFVKAYWVSFNIAVPSALLITVFYWSLLTNIDFGDEDSNFAVNKVLDVFIHGVNSVVMLLLLLSSRHELRIPHVLHLVAYLLVYLLFSVIYFAAGGTNGYGQVWIYPMLDWSNPGPSVLMTFLTLLMSLIIYLMAVLLAAGRDALAKWWKGETVYLNRI